MEQDIDQLLNNGKTELAITMLDASIKAESRNDKLYYQRGNAYFKMGNWKEAIQNYLEAVDINPDSPAAEAVKMATDILNYYNKDIYNQ